MKYYMEALRRYVDFAGRASRTEFWMFTLVNFVIIMVLEVLMFAVGRNSDSTMNGIGMFFGALLGLYSLAVLLPSIAVGIRRLHDTGRSAWWILIGFVPFVGGIILIILYCIPGQPEPNQWGPNPKLAAATA